MVKFCGECGTRLGEDTGICPECNTDNRKRNILKHAGESTIGKSSEKKIGRKKRKILSKFIWFVLFFGVGAVSVLGALLYFDIIETSDILNIIKMEQNLTEIQKDIPDTDMNGISFYESSESNIVTEGGITFVNNEILVVLESNSYKSELDKYLSERGARIVGELTAIAEYQILFDNACSHSEILNIKDELETFDWVVYASLNYAMKSEPSYIPNDSKWKNEWEDVPDGGNWGMEAIDAPAAWDYADELQTVNIGVIDDMFDINHEDLDFVEVPLGQYGIKSYLESKENEWSDHGTHVAGTIAATYDNRKGVSGISVKTNLYGVTMRGVQSYGYDTLQQWKLALMYLIDSKKCSVVNVSYLYDELAFNASRGCEASLKYLEEMSDSMSKFLEILIDKKYEFVICVAAGNQNDKKGDYKYYLRDKESFIDEENECMYYSSGDYEEFLKGKADKECREYFERHKNELNISVADGGCLDVGDVDAKYNFFSLITDQKVELRIIVVGAVENLGTNYEGGFLWFGRDKVHNGYKLALYSQCGERVDVLAPGTNIQSTVRGGYAVESGTSMATPHVAGTAGLAFAANPNMTGAGAKEIIKNSVSGSYGKENYGIINTKKVVESAFRYVPENEKDTKGELEEVQSVLPEIKIDDIYGSWLQLDTDAPIVLTFNVDGTLDIRYYDMEREEYHLQTVNFKLETELGVNVLKTSKEEEDYELFPHIIEIQKEKVPLQMEIIPGELRDGRNPTDGTYKKLSFTEEQLELMKTQLNVPADLEVTIKQSVPYYWYVAKIWVIQVDMYRNNQYIAGAAFNTDTLEKARHIYMYSGD